MKRRKVRVYDVGQVGLIFEIPRIGPVYNASGRVGAHLIVFDFRVENDGQYEQKRQQPAKKHDDARYFVRSKSRHLEGILNGQVAVDAQHDQYENARALTQVHERKVDLAKERAEQPLFRVDGDEQKRYEQRIEEIAYGQIEQIEVGHRQLAHNQLAHKVHQLCRASFARAFAERI